MLDLANAELARLASSLVSSEAREQITSEDILRILEGFKAASCGDDVERLVGFLRLIRNMVAGVERNANQVSDYFNNSFDFWVSSSCS